MRQLFLEKGALAIREVCQPVLDDYSILVSVSYSFMSMGAGLASIARSNHHLFMHNVPHKVKKIIELVSHRAVDTGARPKDKHFANSLVLGNSSSGIVLAIGKKVKKFRVGDFVACAAPGLVNHADIVCVPEHLVVQVNSESLLKQASLAGVGAIAMHGVRRADVQLGESVIVFGLDAVGHLMMRLAALSGCSVFGVDSDPARLAYAQKIGTPMVYNFLRDNMRQAIDLLTAGRGVDCVIISPDCMDEAVLEHIVELVRKKGRIIIAGNHHVAIPAKVAHQKEVDILFALSYGPGRHDAAYEYQGQDYPYPYVRWTENRNMELFLRLVEQGSLKLDDFLEKEVHVQQFPVIVDKITRKEHVGVLFNFAPGKLPEMVKKQTKDSFVPALRDGHIRLGVAGIGRFMRLTLMPVAQKLDNVILDALVDDDSTRLTKAAKLYAGAHVMVGGAYQLRETAANTLFISPSMDIEVDDIIALLQQKKALFLARPLEATEQELQRLQQFLQTNPEAQLCIGFHRSHAPFIQKIKRLLVKRSGPLMIHYRINVGAVDLEEKMHPQWKAGRVIGQASHIFDLFCTLTGARPTAIAIDSVRSTGDESFPTDNFVAHVTFDDGSLCSLLFTSFGNAESGTERMELFVDAKTIIMEDFLQLKVFGVDSADEKARTANTGYQDLIKNFFNELQYKTQPVSADRLLAATKLAVIADALVCQGGGEQQLKEL